MVAFVCPLEDTVGHQAWGSAQAGFAVLIALAALISVIDPFYYGWLSQRRWLFLAYHSLALFVLLLTALPLTSMETPSQLAKMLIRSARAANMGVPRKLVNGSEVARV